MTRPTRSTSTEGGTDPGEVSIETVILIPVVMFLVLMSVQAAVLLHGVTMAEHISMQGAAAAARYGTSESAGMRAAEDAASSLGARLWGAPLVSVTADDVTVEVSVRVPRAVPLFPEVVARTTTVPRERFTAYGER